MIFESDNAITCKLKSISLFWYLSNFLKKDKSGLLFEINTAWSVFTGRFEEFASFSYLNHSFIVSLNVKVSIRFIVFLQIYFCFFFFIFMFYVFYFFISFFYYLCWMKGLCIASHHVFCFQSEGGVKSLRTGGVKRF